MPATVFFFGDQTGNLVSAFRQLQKDRTEAELSFIQRATDALRHLVAGLPRLERQDLPSFDRLHNLILQVEENQGVCHPALSSALLTIIHLIQVYRYFSNTTTQERPSRCSAVGLCTGALAASAFASSSSLDDLDRISIPIVRLAFHVGLQASRAAANLLPHGRHTSQKWSVALANATEDVVQNRLKSYNSQIQSFKSRHLHLTAVTPNGVSISGCPLDLQKFVDSLENVESSWLPIFSPYHMQEFHSDAAVSSVFECLTELDLADLTSSIQLNPLFSPSQGTTISGLSTLELLKHCVKAALLEPLRCDRIVSNCAEISKAEGAECIDVVVSKPSTSAKTFSVTTAAQANIPARTHNITEYPAKSNESSRQRRFDEPLAIVGMAGRFPDSNNHEEFWDLLEKGLDVHREVPDDRFDVDRHVDPAGKAKNTSWTPYGCFMNNPGLFDPKFFNLSPREAIQTCSMQRLALVTAYEALEMSGFVPNRTPSTNLDRIGTFYGQTSDDYREVNAGQEVGTYYITGGIRAFGPGRINYHFKFNGPSLSVDTACSSSLAAIQVGCTSIWSGDCDTAVAGGMNVLSNPDLFAGLSRGQFLSKTGSCKTFDQSADGYCRGDGVASVIIKRLSDAQADNDRVLAVIRSAATNHSSNAVSITHPHASTQSKLYREVLQRASINPEDVCYVEMHGTGTQAGDGTEMKSVTDVFAPAKPSRRPNNPLFVGSTKANTGHGEAVSGVTALVKSIMMLQKNAIPPHCGIKGQINQGFPDLKARNVHIAMEKTVLPKLEGKPRMFLVNNFSAAGGNTALVLQEAPERAATDMIDQRSTFPITFSGHTMHSLRSNIEQLLKFVDKQSVVDIPSLSFTTTARRTHQKLRHTVSVGSAEELKRQSKTFLDSQKTVSPGVQGKVTFAFTGQGSHYSALGQQLFQGSKQFRSELLAFEKISQELGFASFIPLIDGSRDVTELSPVQVQLGITCVQMALGHLIEAWGVKPDAVIGHSLGEYAAAHVAGILSAKDTIFLVGKRASLFEQNCTPSTHAMLAVGATASQLESILDGAQYELACFNTPNDTVLSGPTSSIDDIHRTLTDQKLRCTKLPLPFAYHSAQVESIMEDFEKVTQLVTFESPRVPYISSYLGRQLSTGECVDSNYWLGHARKSVKFYQALEAAQADNIIDATTTFIEIGPHPVCMNMVKSTLGTKIAGLPTLRKGEDAWKMLSSTMASLHDSGHFVDWSEYHRDYSACHEVLHLPTYAWDNKNFWHKYEGGWTLTKGAQTEPKMVTSPSESKKMITTSLQHLVSENLDSKNPEFIFDSSLAEPHLHGAVTGHLVNGAGLCPSSVYADMAFTAADVIRKKLADKITLDCANVVNMAVPQPCIVDIDRDKEKRTMRLTAVVDYNAQTLNVTFASASDDQWSKATQHATCTVQYGNSEKWISELSRSQHFVEDRMKTLCSGRADLEVHRMGSSMAYRLFASLVDYSQPFRGMKEVYLNTPGLEATANVTLSSHENSGTFFQNPHWIDSVAHISGFVMNGNELHDPAQHAYISHGWESMKFCQQLVPGNDYQIYVKMMPIAKTTFGGDVWVLKGGKAIGLIGNLKFQQIPRAVLNTILPPAKAVQKQNIVHNQSQSKPVVTKPAKPLAVKPNVTRQAKLAKQVSGSEQVLILIAQELGVARSDLSSADHLTELGIDSLMSLTIISKLREELQLEVASSLFVDHPTIGQLGLFFDKTSKTKTVTQDDEEEAGPDSGYSSGQETICESSDYEEDTNRAQDKTSELAVEDNIVITTIAEEMGVSIDELTPDVELSDYGMDSLMSLTILSKLRETKPDLSNSFFTDNPTVAQVLDAISGPQQAPKKLSKASKLDDGFAASSVFLQGGGTGPKLFLFPDGSGSSVSYSALRRLTGYSAVYGLQCPYLKKPTAWKTGVEGVVDLYLQEILSRQSQGPYVLGGWSVGGVLAYEAARKLIMAGKQVSQLLLIDAPCPLTTDPMPSSLITFLNEKGVFSDRKMSPDRQSSLIQHFDATVANLGRYSPLKIPAHQTPAINIIWAKSGVCSPQERREFKGATSVSKWILEDRSDDGPQGWEQLLPADRIKCFQVQGNHFTMMKDENAGALTAPLTYGIST